MTTSRIVRRSFVLAATFWLAAALFWTMGVLVLGLRAATQPSWLFSTFGDKLVHAAAFTVGGFLWMKSMISLWRRQPYWAILLGIIITLLIGFALEIFQRYAPGRQSDMHDLAADAVGVLPAVLLLIVLQLRKPGRLSVAD